MNQPPVLEAASNGKRLAARGSWTVANAAALERLLTGLPQADGFVVDAADIVHLDTFGAWTIERVIRNSRAAGHALALVNVPERYNDLLGEVEAASVEVPEAVRRRGVLAMLDGIGRAVFAGIDDLTSIVAMAGAFAIAFGRAIRHPRSFRPTSIVSHLDRVGWQAIGIILLITFLIGAIIAQQGIFNFRRFGAQDYVVNLVGILVLREIGVLLVAIMVAGRSGSSFTAELGSMKMREEVDALRTMGIDPVEILVLPRVIALIVALPVLTFIGSMAALVGGGLVAWFYGGMSPELYAVRLHDAVSVHDYYIGLIKAPVMAAVIGIVACSEGFKVTGSTESLGLRTTASVVKAIFLVIVLDGLFAIFFASIGW
ncbi:MAG TPA: ABC transporter permease [Bauldia sp.]|nr:ABC transporter permease [Bauldia sp.]